MQSQTTQWMSYVQKLYAFTTNYFHGKDHSQICR